VFKQPNQLDVNTVLEKLDAAASPAPIASAPPARRIDWRRIIAIFYLYGACACAFWMFLGNLLLHRLTLRALPASAQTLSVFRSLNPTRHIHLLVSTHTDRPISFGLFRPIILLPARILENPNQLRHILLHELAHIRQRDALGHFLFNLLFPVLYFHPLYWWLRSRTNLARELIADDAAASFTSRESYAADLLAIAKDRFQRAALSTHALGLFQSKTDFYRRMHMLVAHKSPLQRECSLYWRLGWSTMLIIALVLVTGMFGVRRANAQNLDNDKEREAQIQKLRAEQAALEANLAALEAQKRDLQEELDARQNDQNNKVQALLLRNKEQALIQQKLAEDKAAMAKAVKQKLVQNDEKIDFVDKNNKKDPRGAQQNVMELGGRAQLDLVSLASAYVDSLGEVEIAQLRAEQAKGHRDMSETRIAQVQMETAKRKNRVFRGIAEAALESAKAELDTVARQHEMGIASRSAMSEAQSRLRILEVILSN
jgi:beta-lactamase regulating signal transducer with metallopeptidase domain